MESRAGRRVPHRCSRDSFAFGVVGYARNFLTLLETELSARVGRPSRSQISDPRHAVQEYLQILLDDGLVLHPIWSCSASTPETISSLR